MNSDSMFDMSSNMDNTELHTSSVDVGQPATTRSLYSGDNPYLIWN